MHYHCDLLFSRYLQITQSPVGPIRDSWLWSVRTPTLENINPMKKRTVLLTVVSPVPRTISGMKKGEKAGLERPTGRRNSAFFLAPTLYRQGSKVIVKTCFSMKRHVPFEESGEGRMRPTFFCI